MPTLAAKLQISEGALYLLNAPPKLIPTLAKRLGGVPIVKQASGSVRGALLFVSTLAEAEKLAPKLFDAMGEDALTWVAYPKGGGTIETDLNRDRLWHALESTGWRPVRQVALDDTWSAMRFRPVTKVKTKKKATKKQATKKQATKKKATKKRP